MKINEVQVNPQDPKAKTEIEGTITQIMPIALQNGQQVTQQQTDWGIKQFVICDGITATFWAGKTPLTIADLNKPMKLLCNARLYNGQLQYSISRPRTGGGRSFRDYDRELKEKNRSVALSYALELLKLPLGAQAYKAALEMAEFFETGKLPLRDQASALVPQSNIPEPDPDIVDNEPPPTDDDIPYFNQ